MATPVPTAQRIPLTDDEQAVLRSWLGSNKVADIAKAHKTTPAKVNADLARLCDLNRARGRDVLAAGWYTPGPVAPRVPDLPAVLTRPRPAPEPAVAPEPPKPARKAAAKAAPRKPAAKAPKPAAKAEPLAAAVPLPVATGQPIRNGEQYRILLPFSTGAALTDIARIQQLPLDYVAGVVRALTGLDRKLADELVVAYERDHRNPAGRPTKRNTLAAVPPDMVTAETVAERTGLSLRQIDYWCRLGYLRPVGGDGSGNARLFPPDELRVAIVMARLNKAGIAPDAARRVACGETELAPGVRVLVDEPVGGQS